MSRSTSKTARGGEGRKIRVGIAGQGRSGHDIHAVWLRQATEQYEIVAAADLLPARRAQAKKEFGCRVCKDYTDLLGDENIDLFVNALPSNLHPAASVEALKAGHHVVSEKPTATRLRDFDRVISAARDAGRTFAPFQNSRFYPFFGKLMEIVASGVLGEIVHVRINWSGYARRWDWQTLQKYWGGNINNTGPHPLDHAVMLFGNKTPKVFARLKSGPNTFGDADDFAAVTLYGGRKDPHVEVLVSSYLGYPQGEKYYVGGSRGALTGGPGGLRWKTWDPKQAPRRRMWKNWSKDRQYCSEELPWKEHTWTPPKTDLGGFSIMSKGFYDNLYDVLTGRGKLTVTHAQVRRQVAVLEQCHAQNRLSKAFK